MNEELEGASHHVPVLLGPAITGLNLKADGCYVDGTFGRGGHSPLKLVWCLWESLLCTSLLSNALLNVIVGRDMYCE